MMGISRTVKSGLPVALLVLVACGSPNVVGQSPGSDSNNPDQAEEFGSCPAERLQAIDGLGHLPLSARLTNTRARWVEAVAATPREAGHRPKRHGLKEAFVELQGVRELRGGPVGSTVAIYEPDLPPLKNTQGKAKSVVLGVEGQDDASVMAAVLPNDSVVFVGECEAAETRAFREFVAANGRGRSGAEVLREIVSHPDGPLASALKGPTTPSWSSRRPDHRVFDIEDTPQEVLSALHTVILEYRLPDTWKGMHGTLCTKTSQAWNNCVRLNARTPGPSIFQFGVYVVRSENLEVWLLGSGADVRAPLARLATISAQDLAGAEGVALAGKSDVRTREDVIRRSQAGEALLEVVGTKKK